MASRRVSTKTGASAPSKGFKTATGKGRGGAAAGPGSRKPAQKPQVVAFNESTVDAINRTGPPGHEIAHINPREGRLLEALGGSGEKDPETNIKSYEVVGEKTGEKTKLPKGGGRGRFPGYKGDEHQVAVLTDLEVEALNTLRYKDKDRGYTGGKGPEIQALADQNDRPFEYLEYRGEKIPTLNGGGEDDDMSGDEGEKDSGGNYNTSDNTGSYWDTPQGKALQARLVAKEKARLAKIKAEKDAADKAEKEAERVEKIRVAKELAEKKEKERLEKIAKQEMKETIAAAEREEKRALEKIEKEKEKARIRKEKREAKALADKEALEAEEAEVMTTIEADADEAAELDLEGKNQDIGTEYDFDFESGDRIGEPVVGMDGYVWGEVSGYGGASATDAYEPVKEEEYLGPTIDDIDMVSYFDPDDPPEPDESEPIVSDFEFLATPTSKSSGNPNQDAADEEDDSEDDGDDGGDEINDTSSGEADALGGDSGDDAGTGDTGYDPDKDTDILGGDSHDEGDDTLGGDTHDGAGGGDSTGGISVDEVLDDALDENLGGDAGDDETSIDDTDDDLGNDSEPGGYDPDKDTDILGGDTHDDSHDGGSVDDTVVVTPGGDGDGDGGVETGDGDTGDDDGDGGDQEKLLEELEEKYAKYGETDYRKLYFDEFDDDRKEDYAAAKKGSDFNFLTSSDRSEFNTSGDTINDQQIALGERLEGEELDALNEQSDLYAEAPNAAIEDWYKKQRIAILRGEVDSVEPLDLSEWSDPSEAHDPEFFGAEDETGDKVFDKRYYDPDKEYYSSGTSLPVTDDTISSGDTEGDTEGDDTPGWWEEGGSGIDPNKGPDPLDIDFGTDEPTTESSTEGSGDLHGEVVDGEFVPDTLDDEGNDQMGGNSELGGIGSGSDGLGDVIGGDDGFPEGHDPITGEPLDSLSGDDTTSTELTVDENGLPQGTTIAPGQPEPLEEAPLVPEIVEPEEEEIVPIKHETDPNYGGTEPIPESAHFNLDIDEHIIDDPDNPVGDESSDYDGRYEGMSEDDIYDMVDLYNEENEFLPGDDGYRYGEDEIAYEYGEVVKNPDDYSFADQADAYNTGMGLNPGDPGYMYVPETEDTPTITMSGRGSGGGSYTRSSPGTDTTGSGETHFVSAPTSRPSEPTYTHYAGGGSGGSGMDFTFSDDVEEEEPADMSFFDGQDEFYDTNTFDPGNPDAWMNAPVTPIKDTRVNNKTKPLRPSERRRGSGGGSYNYGPHR